MKMSFKVNYSIYFFITFFIISCARKGSPSGGPKDLDPPILVKATPDTFSTHVSTKIKNIELEFDEYVVLKDFTENFLISPPIDPAPVVTPMGGPTESLFINFNSELKPETTYTINFGQSLQDNNEGNQYPYFSYIFSTGDYIDSLQLKGNIDFPLKKDKEIKNIVAALYKIDSAYTDSIIYKEKPYYITKADSAFNFNLKNLKAGEYRLVAFNDEIPNLKFDAKTENFGFYPTPVNPVNDSLFNIKLYQPIIPFRFVEAKQIEQGKITFYFEGNPKQIDIKPISHNFSTGKIIHKPYSDTLTYYFNPTAKGDTLLEKRPKLKFAYTHQNKTDTIPSILYDQSKITPLKVYLRGTDYVPGDIYQLEANYPLDTLDKTYISVIKDSIDLDFDVNRLQHNRFGLDFPLEFESQYKVVLYPNAVKDMLGRTNDTINLNLKIKSEREYGNLHLKINQKPLFPTWLKLYDANDKEIKSIYSEQDEFNFKYLKPGKYHFKLLVDENRNERYDTGNFLEERQPEQVYVYPEPIQVKAFWDLNEVWELNQQNDVKDKPIKNKQIPKEILIEKPLK